MVMTEEIIREAFKFLVRQRYPCSDAITPLRNYLIDHFELDHETDMQTIVARVYFRFTYTDRCLITDKYIRSDSGKEKAISFRVKEEIDIDNLVQKTLNNFSQT